MKSRFSDIYKNPDIHRKFKIPSLAPVCTIHFIREENVCQFLGAKRPFHITLSSVSQSASCWLFKIYPSKIHNCIRLFLTSMCLKFALVYADPHRDNNSQIYMSKFTRNVLIEVRFLFASSLVQENNLFVKVMFNRKYRYILRTFRGAEGWFLAAELHLTLPPQVFHLTLPPNPIWRPPQL